MSPGLKPLFRLREGTGTFGRYRTGEHMDFSTFQKKASLTSQLELGGPQAAIAPMLGLASETGSILDVYKRYLQDKIDLATNREFLKEELGDALWYLAAVATAVGLDLEEIAVSNIERTQDLYPLRDAPVDLAKLPVFDSTYPDRERFPRRLVFEFREQLAANRLVASISIVEAQANVFPSGAVEIDGNVCGFSLGTALGDPLTDNARRPDSYRYHDAIHIGFMAVLGWSPIMRTLLNVRRRSNNTTNECDDGARAKYAEEGLAAILARLAKRRSRFHSEVTVDSDAIAAAKSATEGLEVSAGTAWLWRRAISNGFVAMHLLGENGGGFLIADLDAREVRYQKTL